MRSTTQSTRDHLDSLANSLQGSRDEIVEAWRRRVDDDPVLETASRLDKTQFIDHIPHVIDGFCCRLRSWPDNAPTSPDAGQEAVVSHSQHRWQQGYDIRDLTREWGHLNLCLVLELDNRSQCHSQWEMEALPQARRMLAEMINDSIAQSVIKFHHLLQSEAATRVRELEAALEYLKEMEQARGELLRTAVHDLRNSVGVVSGTATLLDDARLTEEDNAETRLLLKKSTASLEQMLHELMDMARLEAGQEKSYFTEFDVEQVLGELSRSAQPLADERGLSLEVKGHDRFVVEGDEIKVRRITQNLLSNALKYTHRGGVTLSWEKHNDKYWRLCVSDTGPGLEHSPAAPLARELQAATQSAHEIDGEEVEPSPLEVRELQAPTSVLASPAATHGEGIGLSIVKRLCELLDATLELESKAGVGTTFRVLFPYRYN